MSSTRLALASLFVAGVTSLAGCSTETASSDVASGGDEQDITGVTDLSELESAFGLSKDTKDAQGNWGRHKDILTNGPCYKRTVGGPDGASYQFRRYSSGAAFFKKLGAGPQSGDERPVVCVDVDRWGIEGVSTMEVDDFQVDSAIRYRLGAPTGGDGAAGSYYEGFANGHFRFSNWYCSEQPFEPLNQSAFGSSCLSEVTFPGGNGVDADLVTLVYQYAHKHAVGTDRFSTLNDAAGRFVSMEGSWETKEVHLHFERLDAHLTRFENGSRAIFLTPKGTEPSINLAVAACLISASGDDGRSTYGCNGL